MEIKKIFSIYILFFLVSGYVIADNPGEEVVESQAEETTQSDSEAPASESTGTSSSSGDEEVVQLQKVVVTGSRIKRTDLSGALPLLVITKEDIDAGGFRNITEALQAIPAANAYNQNEQNTNLFTPNANSLNLRNIGPSKTLYLINGRRTADYPLPYNNASNIVNTSTIPNGLIDRIEILSQGSSAIYGSDAVGGVVNIITKDGMDYSQVDAYASVTEHGNDMITNFTFSTGGFFGASSWTLGMDVSHVDPMYLADRDGYNDWKDDPDYGLDYIGPRWGAAMQVVPWYLSGGDAATYSPEDFGYACDSKALSGGVFRLFSRDKPEVYGITNYPGSYQGYACAYNRGANGGDSTTIVNERDDYTIMGTFTHNFDNGNQFKARLYHFNEEAYLRSSVSRYVSLGSMIDSRIYQCMTLGCGDSAGPVGNDLVPAGNPVLRASYLLRYFTPAMGRPFEARSDYEEDMTDFYMGLSGTMDSGHEWSVGANMTRYNSFYADSTLTQKAKDYMAGVGMTNADGSLATGWYAGDVCQHADSGMGGLLAGFGFSNCFFPERIWGPISTDLFQSWLVDDSVDAESYQYLIDADITGEVMAGNTPVAFNIHAEYQYQDYEVIPSAGRLDDEIYGGDDAIKIIQGSTRYGFGDRSRMSLGVELAAPINDKLEVTFATRYDSYDDDSSSVGSRVSSMFNFAYRPTEDFLLRGSAGQTFRAPDMHYIYSQPSSVFSYGTDYPQCYANYLAGATGTGPIAPGDLATKASLCGFQGSYGSYRKTFQSGDKNLEEEEGVNYSLGFVLNIGENVSWQWDAFHVYLENGVAQESNTSQLVAEGVCLYGQAFSDWYDFSENIPARDCDTVASNIERSSTYFPGDAPTSLTDIVSITRNPRNQGYIEYVGHDTYINWRKETESAGDFAISIGSTTIDHINYLADPYGEQIEFLTYYYYEPRSRQNVNFNYKYEQHNVSVNMTRMGHMNIYGTAGGGTKSDPHIMTNVSYSYDWSPDIDTYVSIRNIDDVMPQKDTGYSYPFFNEGYYSAFGRYLTAGITYRF